MDRTRLAHPPLDHRQLEEHARADMVRRGQNPDLPPNHPVNALSPVRKLLILLTLSFSGLLANFAIAIILVAFPEMGKQFGVSPGDIPNTIGYQLLGMAVGPIFWNPLSKTIGRRPVYLIGSFLCLPMAVWMATSNSYAVFSAARVVSGLTFSFSQTVPPASVADIFRAEVRGHKMSLYGVAVVMAPAVAPVFCGLIVHAGSWRNLFWFILGLSGLQFVLYFFLVPETLWVPDEGPLELKAAGAAADKVHLDHIEGHQEPLDAQQPASAHRNGHVGAAWMPWHRPREYLQLFMSPILMVRFLVITVPSFYYGSLFAWSVGITIVMPQKFEKPPYGFTVIPLGCAFLAFGIGSVLGKWSGGLVGDHTVAYFERKHGRREPEDRLWALLPMLPFMFVSLLVVGLSIDRQMHWAVLLVLGGLYYFALTAATGILATYVLECFLARSMDTQAVFTFWKMMWGFAIPFFIMDWGGKSGFTSAYAVQGALAAGGGALLVGVLLWRGRAIRLWQGMPEFER